MAANWYVRLRPEMPGLLKGSWRCASVALTAVALSSLMAACATTDPRTAADIRYRLPRTDAKVNLALTLRDCSPIRIDVASTSLSPVVRADKKEYVIPADKIASSRVARKLKVELSDEGVLTAINTTSTDKTAQIIGNYIQGIAQIAGAVLLAPAPSPEFVGPRTPVKCHPATAIAVDRHKKIADEIDSMRHSPKSPPVEYWKTMQALAAELGALEAYLTIDVKGSIEIEKDLYSQKAPASVKLGLGPFEKWFVIASPEELAENVELKWWGAEVVPTTARTVARKCDLGLSIPAPTMVTVKVEGRQWIGKAQGDVTFPAAQRGSDSELCLDVAIGEGRTVALTLDNFGRTKVYDWSSDASAEAISAAFAGSSKSIASIVPIIKGPSDLDRKQNEITELEAELKVQDLRACIKTRQNGGSCPKP